MRAQVLHAAGVLAFYQDDYARAHMLLQDSLEPLVRSQRDGALPTP